MESSESIARPTLQRLFSSSSRIRRKLSFRLCRSGSKNDDDAPTTCVKRGASFSSARGLPPLRPGGRSGGKVKSGRADEYKYTGPTFPLFSLLGDDLAVSVLSFVSYAPFEGAGAEEGGGDDGSERRRLYDDYIDAPSAPGRKPIGFVPFRLAAEHREAALSSGSGRPIRLDPSSFGTLTHVLPLVCTSFRDYCRTSDVLWYEALGRKVLSSHRWRRTVGGWSRRKNYSGDVRRLMSPDDDVFSQEHLARAAREYGLEACSGFAAAAEADAPAPPSDPCDESVIGRLYRRVASDSYPRVFGAPLLYLSGGSASPRLGEPIRLHLLEPRHKILIEDVMRGRSLRDRSGVPLLSDRGAAPRPRFVYVSGVSKPLVRGDPALVVEVTECKIHGDGRADVSLVPVRRATLLTMRERANSGRLLDATVRTEPRRAGGGTRRGRSGAAADLVGPPTFRGLVFHTRAARAPELGCELSLRLSEPQHRLLIREVTEGLRDAYRWGGEPIPVLEGSWGRGPVRRPRFVYAYGGGNLGVGAPAVVAEVRRCRIASDRTAHVTLVPVEHATIAEMEERPGSGGLYNATVELLV